MTSVFSRGSLIGGLIIAVSMLAACTSEQKDLLDLAINEPSEKDYDRSIVGVNNFFEKREFGNISQQFSEISGTLGVRYVRVLFAWDDNVQGAPGASRNYSFFDDIVDAIPGGTDVVVVLAHTPSWMANSANWIEGDPRKTWVEKWLKPTVKRYAGRRGIVGWEVWNEPDLTTVASDGVLGLNAPENYFKLLQLGSSAIRSLDPTRLVLNAATESIQQNDPANLNYNEQLRDLGAESLVDVWNVHYYGKQFEKVISNGGVADFLNGLSVPIWVTESGSPGVNSQLKYSRTVWPFLLDEVERIERIYWYEFSSRGSAADSLGLRTTDPGAPVSDLYIWLRDHR